MRVERLLGTLNGLCGCETRGRVFSSWFLVVSRGEPRSATEGLEHILAFQIRVLGQDFLDGVACSNLADDHAHCHAHTADARLSTHDLRVLRDAIQLCHASLQNETLLCPRIPFPARI